MIPSEVFLSSVAHSFGLTLPLRASGSFLLPPVRKQGTCHGRCPWQTACQARRCSVQFQIGVPSVTICLPCSLTRFLPMREFAVAISKLSLGSPPLSPHAAVLGNLQASCAGPNRGEKKKCRVATPAPTSHGQAIPEPVAWTRCTGKVLQSDAACLAPATLRQRSSH